MRPIYTLSFSLLLACGPLAPPLETTTAANSDTLDSGETTQSATTIPDPTTRTTTTDAATSEPTGEPTSSPAPDTSAFIVKLDTPVLEDCDIWAQNCPQGSKCTPWAEGGGGAWNATKCVDITGDGAPGEPCTATGGGVSGIDDCALGAMCWDVDTEGNGTCIKLCTGSVESPVCPPKFQCSLSSEGVLILCIPECDPLLQDCPGDDLCIPNFEKFLCVLDASGEMGAVNDPCEFNACDKGLVCLNTASASIACQQGPTGCCQPFCKLPDAPCPNPDQECLPWFDPMMAIPPGYEDVGFCGIPE